MHHDNTPSHNAIIIPSESKIPLNLLDDLVVSDSLSCSFCNTVFEDQTQQRLHYKLDWHRYNLKQRLHGLKSVTEDGFSLIADKDDVSSISGSEQESENEDDTGTSETGGKSTPVHSGASEKKQDTLLATACRHPKVFFENDDGNIFSIYRCLLHNKKEIPEVDNEMTAQALESGKKAAWTLIMLGGGHFAAAVFLGGEAVVHKTFHSYTVRARQGSSQSSRDVRAVGSRPKSAGASLRRYNEAALLQHVQDILDSWSTHIANSSLILFRAVGPYNRSVLFGGKNPPLDKNDLRLRPLPFPTRRATFSEVKRVYDILSTMEIYGSAADFTHSFPISPRQPLRKKTWKVVTVDEEAKKESVTKNDDSSVSSVSSPEDNRKKESPNPVPDRQARSSRMQIDRAKPRKSPRRPLPDIVARLARSSSESEYDGQEMSADNIINFSLSAEDYEIDFKENLQEFEDTVPRYLKNKKIRPQKRKTKKERSEESVLSNLLMSTKLKLWSAFKSGDFEALTCALEVLLNEVKNCEEENEEGNKEIDKSPVLRKGDVKKMVNDPDEDGNTMLHMAAINGYRETVWVLLDIGSDPCKKNKKFQTPYVSANDKETRNTFRRFMGSNPGKFNYNKSQIPGPLNNDIESEELEKKKQQKKLKRERKKEKRQEFEMKKQEEAMKQDFLNLSDREKRAVAAERRMLQQQQGNKCLLRCFQCGTDINQQVAFECNANQFCSMPCLKEHRLHHKFIA
ncbi:ankyrin repeat and zinc finger domain-containing protein 1-like isoform X2 [Belonocnema kinseyi]|uniref:ankyrin repeat and zinc finger domain-containing protein 1-like isoform X2 n=1 Tax=Belonocnema kinseyi TaxID=2817044 RepID=UPI00143DEF60|nr:ankyrin repeat and zinc finger domain-containing protein 1-like isoform X2 [Belonocnema kinseyi]